MIYKQEDTEFLEAVKIIDICRDAIRDEEVDEFYMLTGFDLRCYGTDDFDLQKGDNFVLIEMTDEGINIDKGRYACLTDLLNEMQ